MLVRFINPSEWNESMSLCWKTFLEFEADEYTPEGVKNFFDFVTSTQVEEMYLNGNYKAVAAFDGNKIVGFLGFRNINHISLLFVNKEYHHQGIATMLIEFLVDYLVSIGKSGATVYSSPYAVGFYHKLGFVDTDKEQMTDGITYTPMYLSIL